MKNQRVKWTGKWRISPVFVLLLILTIPASAGGLADSTLGSGVKQLLNDASSLLTILCPIVGGAAAGFFAIRRSMADEQDGKLWEKRIKTAIFCGVGGCLTSAVIAVLSSYF